MAGGRLERLHHAGDDGLAGQDVALRGAVLAGAMAGPDAGLRPGERRRLARLIDHRELPALLGPALRLRVAIAVPDRVDDRRRRHAGAQQGDRLRAVADVDDRLRRRRADAGFGPQHAVADGEDARLHCPADLAGRRIESENREGRDRIGLARPLPGDRDRPRQRCRDRAKLPSTSPSLSSSAPRSRPAGQSASSQTA